MDFLTLLNATPVVAGVWSSITGFFANCIEWLFEFTMSMGIPSYVLAIAIFTLIVKLITQPLQMRQMRSSRRMKMLAPEVEQIKKRYASNPQKQQQLTMALYKEHGASPTAGCLPLLVQMPILIALFTAIRTFGAEGSIHPLAPEYFNFLFWTDLSALVKDTPYFMILPVIAAAVTFLQQWVTTTDRSDRMQRTMLIAMPMMFAFMSSQFPVLLAMYWIFYTVFGVAISYPVLRHWDKKDKATIEAKREEKEREADEKRAKKEAARAAKRAKAKTPQQAAKPSYEVHEDDFAEGSELATTDGGEIIEGQFYDVEDDEDEENIDLDLAAGIDEDLDPEEKAIRREEEKLFQIWLKEHNFVVTEKKVKLHPYSSEKTVVKMILDDKGREHERETLLRRFHYDQSPQSMGQVFGFNTNKKKKNKKGQEDNDNNSETK